MDRAIKAVFHIVGIPSSVNFYKKYLLKSFDGSFNNIFINIR